ncbi:MAG TPA: SCP2 sterol-binding domain-containing protein [Acidimicrobiia bacterium]|nr:SCP2 sterol-binding domain-containing protein [Acidimicrobiia bacterium]
MADDVQFLTPEWAAALEHEANASDGVRAATEGVDLTVQADIPGAEYAVAFRNGSVTVHWGRLEHPDVTLVSSRETAEALSRGTINAQQAFVDGRLRLRGDLAKLTAARQALLRLGDAFASLRSRTRY